MPAIVKSGTFSADSVLVATGTAAVAKAANAILAADGSLTLGSASDPHLAMSCSVGSVESRLSLEPGSAAPTDHRVWNLGHNRNVGGRIDNTKPSSAIQCEYMFPLGGGRTNIGEYHFMATLADGTQRRVVSSSVNDLGECATYFLGDVQFYADDNVTLLGHMVRTGEFAFGATAPGSTQLLVTQKVAATGTPCAFKVKSAAHTNTTTAQDLPQVVFDLTSTQEAAAGAKASWNGVEILKPTFAFVDAPGSSAIADAATFYVSGSPTAGAHATITRGYAGLFAGKLRCDDQLVVNNPTGLRLVTDITAGTPVGIDIVRASTTQWNIQAVSTIHNLGLGLYCYIAGIDGSYTPYPGIFSTTPGTTELTAPSTGGTRGGIVNSNNTAATVGSQTQPSPPFERIAHAWNTGGTPADEQWTVWDQVVVAAGNPSTATWKVTAKRGAAANQPLFAIPTVPVTITGATLAQLITALINAFPFFV